MFTRLEMMLDNSQFQSKNIKMQNTRENDFCSFSHISVIP